MKACLSHCYARAVYVGLFNDSPELHIIVSTSLIRFLNRLVKESTTIHRLTYAAAKNGHMAEALSYISVKRVTPSPAAMFNV